VVQNPEQLLGLKEVLGVDVHAHRDGEVVDGVTEIVDDPTEGWAESLAHQWLAPEPCHLEIRQ
jgi:hypothetical protein